MSEPEFIDDRAAADVERALALADLAITNIVEEVFFLLSRLDLGRRTSDDGIAYP